MPWILAALAVAGGAGYYYTRENPDVKEKAKELEHAGKMRAQQTADDAKEKFKDLKVRY